MLSFTDGKVVKPMVSSMDHKRANDHDTGLNTGGMGTIAPNPYYTRKWPLSAWRKIFLPTIKAMNAEGCPKGCLYFGLMLTPDGPKVIEYNCRLATPERRWCCPCWKATCCTSCRPAPTARWQSRRSNSRTVLPPASFWLPAATRWLTKGQAHHRPCGRPAARRRECDGLPLRHRHHRGRPAVMTGGRVLGVTATGPRLTNCPEPCL